MEIDLRVFGYHSIDKFKDNEKILVLVNNSANFLSYFPGIGTIVGVARVVFCALLLIHSEPEHHDALWSQIGRGFVEVASLGILFLAADILITLDRIRVHNEKIRTP